LCKGREKKKEKKKTREIKTPRLLARSADLLVSKVTSLVETITNSTNSAECTNTHENTNSDHESTESRDTFGLRRRRIRLRKTFTLSNSKAEETFRHNSIINTSNEDVEEFTLHSSESDFSLGCAMSIVVVIDTNLTTLIRASKVNLDLSGKVSFVIASRKSDPVIITDDLVPVTLTRIPLARSISKIRVSGQTIIVVRKVTDTNGSIALSIDHRSLLINIKNEDTRAASKTGYKDPVVCTRSRSPLNLRRTTARWVIIVDLQAITFFSGFSASGAVIEKFKNSIITSMTVASSGNQLGTSTDNSNPDTLHGLVIARAEGGIGQHGIILHTPWELATVDEPSILARTVLINSLFIEINMEVTTFILRIFSGNEHVVSNTIFSNKGSSGATLVIWTSLSNARHLIAVLVNLKTSLENVELVASRDGDGLGCTLVSITPPATTTLNLRTIARLLASIKARSVASEHIREAIDILGVPALRVLGLLIRHDSKGEGNTIKSRRGRRNSDEVTVRASKEDNLGTKTAVIIIGGNASVTRTVMLRARITITIVINIDDGIVNSRRASASGNNNSTVHTLETEVHSVHVVGVAALRESGVEVVSLARVVVRDCSDNDGLEAITIWVQTTFLDSKSETTTSILETGNKDIVPGVHNRTPLHHRSTIASIIVAGDTGSKIIAAFTENRDEGIVVGVGVASVSHEGFTVTLDLVPETGTRSELTSIKDIKASTSFTLSRERKILSVNCILALVVGRRSLLIKIDVEDTSRVQETSNEDVIGDTLFSGELNTALPLIATIIIHSKTLVDITTLLVARGEDKDDRIKRSTLIASIDNNTRTTTNKVVPHTLRAVFISIALDGSRITRSGITFHQFVKRKLNSIFAGRTSSTSKGNCCESCNNK